jgi:hypothetical protein
MTQERRLLMLKGLSSNARRTNKILAKGTCHNKAMGAYSIAHRDKTPSGSWINRNPNLLFG